MYKCKTIKKENFRMNENEKRNFVQNPKELIKYGIISRKGPRNNITDCEADIILIHIPSGTAKRFHGTWWNNKYAESMYDWVSKFPKSKNKITVDLLLHYQTCYAMELVTETARKGLG